MDHYGYPGWLITGRSLESGVRRRGLVRRGKVTAPVVAGATRKPARNCDRAARAGTEAEFFRTDVRHEDEVRNLVEDRLRASVAWT